MAHLSVSLLGAFHVTMDGSSVGGFDTNKTRALLAYTCVEALQAHRRETLTGLLWPEQSDEAARRNLRQALYKLRPLLGGEEESTGSAQEKPSGFLLITPQSVQFNPASDYQLDVKAFTDLIEVCRTHRHRRMEQCSTCHTRLRQAAELYRGDFLDGFFLGDSQAFEEWLVLKREGLRRAAVEVFSNLSTYYETRAMYGPTPYFTGSGSSSEQALHYSYRQLELEPWREEAHRQVMRLLGLSGQRSAALAQYESCRRAMFEELGVEPESETTELYERIKVGDQGSGVRDQGSPESAQSLTPDPRPLIPTSRHNLPAQVAPFIGREKELARITERLDNPDYPLLTLLGPGGVGKTRLALQAAFEQVGTFADGVFWVPLASVSSPGLLASSIAQSIELHFQATVDPQVQLLNYLLDKEMLLVLDNFEHLIDGGAGLLVSILKSAPRISVIVTSRERMGLQAEFLVDLSGLPFPVEDDGLWTMDDGLLSSIVESYGAVQLFVERAQQAHSGFALTHETAQHVVDICRIVAGSPLGIVLAAAWVRHFPVDRIAQSIRANLDFLTSEARDTPTQHSSLRAVFNHSWSLLSEEEQRAFRGLSVFRGGWEEEAAERVAGASLHSLLSLVDKSLLRRDVSFASSEPVLSAAKERRYEIHEVLRQYAGEKLDEATARERAEVESRHAEYYLLLAEEAEGGLTTGEQSKWLQRLEVEHDNLRAVLRWAMEKGEVEAGLRMGGALWRFWSMHGYFSEGRAHLAAVLDLADTPEPTGKVDLKLLAAKARATFGAGALHMSLGDLDAARALFEQSLALSTELGLGGVQGMASSLNTLGIVAHQQGNYDTAQALYEQSLVLRREMEDKWGIASLLNNLGIMAHYKGEYDTAWDLHEESLALRREMGDRRGIASSLENLGHAAQNRGDYDKALALYEESLALTRELGDKWGIALLLFRLGNVAQNKEDYDTARTLHEESLALRRELGDKQGIASSLNSLGIVAYQQEGYDTARALYEDSLALRRELGDKWGIASTLENLGHLAQYKGEYEAARDLHGESLVLRNELGDKRGIASSLAGLGELFTGRAKMELQEGTNKNPEQDGQAEGAVRLFGAVDGLLQSMGCVLDIEVRQPYERSTAEACALVGSAAFEKAWEEGKAMSIEQAIEYALEG